MLQVQSLQLSTHIAASLDRRWAATVHTDLTRLRWRTLGTCHIRGLALARGVSLRGCKHTDGGRRGLVALPASCSIAYRAALKQGAEGSDPCATCTQLQQTASRWSSLGVKKLLDRVHDKRMGLLDPIWGAFAHCIVKRFQRCLCLCVCTGQGEFALMARDWAAMQTCRVCKNVPFKFCQMHLSAWLVIMFKTYFAHLTEEPVKELFS